MKKAALLLAISLCAVGLQAQDPDPGKTDSSQMARIVFGNTVHDYGGIEKGSEGIYTFRFENKGPAPLVLANVSSSCDCTVPSWPKEPIEPGKSGEISVMYNTNIPGPFSATITVSSNASEPKVVLKILGEVVPQSPDRVQNDTNKVARIVFLKLSHNFGTVAKGSENSCTFGFINRGNIPLVVSEVVSMSDFITATWPKEAIMPGDSGVISVTCKPVNVIYFEQLVFVNSNSFDTPAYLQVRGSVAQ